MIAPLILYSLSIKNPKKRKWLAAIAICGRIAESERLSGVDSRFHYLWKEKDPDYPEAFGAALSGSLGFDRLRQNFLRKQVFVSGSTEVDQDELAPEIFERVQKCLLVAKASQFFAIESAY
jgi:hypothetical protein